MVAIELVIAISVPAWFGERSIWLIMKPQYSPALNATDITRMVITTTWLVVFKNPRIMSPTAGTKKAEIAKTHLNLNNTFLDQLKKFQRYDLSRTD